MTTPLRNAAVRRPLLAGAIFLATALSTALLPRNGHGDPPLTADQRAAVKQAETARIEAIAKVYGTVVSIFGNDRQGGGSGVLIDPAGLALTNHHVVAGAGVEGWAGLADGQLYRWRAVGTDPGGDIAMIQLDRSKPFPFAKMGDSDQVRVGDWAMAMGNPFVLAEDYHPTVTLGIVSGVKRYQPAGGKNMLIYGNCIQVDSSINPGNSGGPLFSMQSLVLGINGRGSFKERGRVNVGLGYAVSAKQILNFIPELLATKIAQHGTLDALFTNRGGRVICSTIDTDSQAARGGLQLGDELVSFEGQPIVDANDFTNLITTLPADWPARMVCRRMGKNFPISVRLSPLPYTLTQQDEPEEKPAKPKDRPHVSYIAEAEPPAPKSPKQRGPDARRPKPPKSPWNLAEAGTPRILSVNQANAARIMMRLAETAGGYRLPAGVQAFRFEDEIRDSDDTAGKEVLLLGTDGRFRVDYTIAKSTGAAGYDGKSFWRLEGEGPAKPATLADVLAAPLCLQGLAMTALVNPESLGRHGKLTIDGTDRVGDRTAYRLRLEGADGAKLYVWLSIHVDHNLQRHELLEAGSLIDPVGRVRHVVFSKGQSIDGVTFPQRRMIVRDQQRKTDLEVITRSCRSESSLPSNAFESERHAGQKP